MTCESVLLYLFIIYFLSFYHLLYEIIKNKGWFMFIFMEEPKAASQINDACGQNIFLPFFLIKNYIYILPFLLNIYHHWCLKTKNPC